MKRLITIALIMLVALFCLTACNFTQKLTGTLEENAESASKVDDMLSALSNANLSGAKELMHSDAPEGTDDAIEQMIEYINGRNVTSKELSGINVNVSTGTSGKSVQEELAYKITLDDSTVIYVSTAYLSNDMGSGFISFQIVIGVV